VKRVDSAHRIGSMSSSVCLLLSTLFLFYRATSIYPTCHSRHRQSESFSCSESSSSESSSSVTFARSLFLRALSSARPLVTVVPCYVMSRLVSPCPRMSCPVLSTDDDYYLYHQ
jgi:hypothetical protein